MPVKLLPVVCEFISDLARFSNDTFANAALQELAAEQPGGLIHEVLEELFDNYQQRLTREERISYMQNNAHELDTAWKCVHRFGR